MNTSVISADYREKQQKMIDVQQSWEKKWETVSFYTRSTETSQKGIPLILQMDFTVGEKLYQGMLFELMEVMEQTHPKLTPEMKRMKAELRTEFAAKWVHEALSLNTYYFTQLAEKWGVSDWLVAYLAEQAVRPLLRVISKNHREELADIHQQGMCPCCGEPVRLAQLEDKGHKTMNCPRCYAAWQERRMACSHCGSDKEQDLRYLSVEGEAKAQIHVCNTCHGYLKIIDTRDMLNRPVPDLLDLNTIHLDLIAQERGYGLGGNGPVTS